MSLTEKRPEGPRHIPGILLVVRLNHWTKSSSGLSVQLTDGRYRRGLSSLRVSRVGEKDRDHVLHASTAYAVDDGAS